jgi:hypothetical protein
MAPTSWPGTPARNPEFSEPMELEALLQYVGI